MKQGHSAIDGGGKEDAAGLRCASSTPGPSASGPLRFRVIIVSGLSGAGKTIALRALEDLGYFCIDNLPASLIESFLVTVTSGGKIKKIAIGMDIREKDFLPDAYNILSSLRNDYNLEILFFEAEIGVMVRRYKETRRPHPIISIHKGLDIEKAIEEEKSLLSVIRDASDRIIDTSNFNPHQLRHMMISTYGNGETSAALNISIMSFGFKFGVPQNVDLLFDVRFLPNPYFMEELKALKGTDAVVSDFVFRHDETRQFLDHLTTMLDFLIPLYVKEERAYLIIGIGCTGGRHRSPAIACKVSTHISQKHGIVPDVIHRDME